MSISTTSLQAAVTADSLSTPRRSLSEIQAQQRQDLRERDFLEMQEQAELGLLAERQLGRAARAKRILNWRP